MVLHNKLGFRRRLIREPNSQQHQTMKCELVPFEPEEESTQLQFEESTTEESQRMIMKVSCIAHVCVNLVDINMWM